MGRCRVLDPLTRDYVRSGGTRETTETIGPKVYHALRAHRGAWVGDPDRGSELWRLARGNVTRGTRADADNAIRVALQPFVDEGLARDLRIDVDLEQVIGRIVIESSIVDMQAGAIDLNDVTRFGE